MPPLNFTFQTGGANKASIEQRVELDIRNAVAGITDYTNPPLVGGTQLQTWLRNLKVLSKPDVEVVAAPPTKSTKERVVAGLTFGESKCTVQLKA